MMQEWTLYSFYSNAYIQELVNIGDITIAPLPHAMPLKCQAEFVDWAISYVTDKKGVWVSNENQLELYEKSNDAMYIKLKITADINHPNKLAELNIDKLKLLEVIFSYRQANAMTQIGLLAFNDKDFYAKIIYKLRGVTHYPIGQTVYNADTHEPVIWTKDEYVKMYRDTVALAEKEPRFRLLLEIYSDANKETDEDYQIHKFFTVLEVMSIPYSNKIPIPSGLFDLPITYIYNCSKCGNNFELKQKPNYCPFCNNTSLTLKKEKTGKPTTYQRIEAMLYDIGILTKIKLIPNSDILTLVKIAQKHRDCAAHFGGCHPELNKGFCASYCKEYYGQTKLLAFQLRGLIKITMEFYTKKYGKFSSLF